MRIVRALGAAGVPCLLVVAACGGSSGPARDSTLVESNLRRDTSPAVSAPDSATLVAGNTKFAFAMYQDLAGGGDANNLFYSPYSVSLALAMTDAGAAGSTATEIATALDFELPPAILNPVFDALDLALASRAKGQAGANGAPFQLDVADSIWGDASLTFAEPFLDTLATDYGTGMHVVDFQGSPDAATTKINGWVSNETGDRIQNLLPDGSVTADTRLMLVNAIYFNAGWAEAFDPANSRPGAFHRLDGSTTNPDMMSNEVDGASYFQGDGYEAVQLPYSGNQTSLVIVLPDDGAFATVEGELTGDAVTTLFSSLVPESVEITMPKFTVKGTTISLKTELSNLGMADAFTAAADFSGMTAGAHLFLDDVLQQAFIQVDESGTVAAAATSVGAEAIGAESVGATVTVDRPFFYLIRDIPTNTVLFTGREVDPS